MITRRHFLKSLASTTALVAVPVWADDRIMFGGIELEYDTNKLFEEYQPPSQLNQALYGDTSKTPRDFGLQALVDDKTLQEIHDNAPDDDWDDWNMVDEPGLPPYEVYQETAKRLYEWKTWAGSMTMLKP